MKPFLKWAGGKHRVAPSILPHLGDVSRRLVEPFAGSCALFLASEFERALLCDVSSDLMSLYTALLHDRAGFSKKVDDLFSPENNEVDAYMSLRKEFNAEEEGTDRRAALFVYLNRHCFNGLCRYNSKGGFNVPFGAYGNPAAPIADMAAFADRCSGNVEFARQGFQETMASAVEGDVVYCDPPYLPLSATASFSDYAKGGFSMKDQEELARLARELADRGIPVAISNHDVPDAKKIYKDAETIVRFSVRRSISAGADSRGDAKEVLALFGKF